MGVTKNGAMLKLIARSRAALLLDNEAMPQEYHYPSLTQLYERTRRTVWILWLYRQWGNV